MARSMLVSTLTQTRLKSYDAGCWSLDMQRRDFVKLLGGAAAVWPLSARSQTRALPVVGILSVTDSDAPRNSIEAILRGLGKMGYADGDTVSIDYRWARGDYGKLPQLASELVSRGVSIIFANGNANVARAAMAATSTIPIVFANGGDPVKLGLVQSINRPDGNVTGVSFFFSALGAKRLEIMRELIPSLALVGFLVNPDNSVTEADISSLEEAARTLMIRVKVAGATSEREFEPAFASLAASNVQALIVNTDAFFAGRRTDLVAMAARFSIPTSYSSRPYTSQGGLLSYGADADEMYEQAGVYVGRILKGAKPADLPVLQPTKFELIVNLKTAKALGLTVSPALLARADEVIE
jgi:putative ABC transport system substrate-binding protein